MKADRHDANFIYEMTGYETNTTDEALEENFIHTGFEGKIHDLCPHCKRADEGILTTIINLLLATQKGL